MSSRASNSVGLLASGLAELVAPSRCLGCRSRDDAIWCGPCFDQVRFNYPACPRCATVGVRRHACLPATFPIAAIIAAYRYHGPLAATIRAAKLAGAHAAWPVLTQRLAERVAVQAPDIDLVTWVTTPRKRARRRGGDHAEAIATTIADHVGVPPVRLLDARDTGNGDHYRYRPRWSLHGATIALADDVVTTGTTVSRAARVLANAGAGRVVVCALARASVQR